MNASPPASPWRIWIDTGGTFTDCIALDPGGAVHRAKVLSSSALRGRIVRVDGPTRLRVREGWNAPTGFVTGLRFKTLESDESVRVSAYEPGADGSLLILESPLPFPPRPDDAFEVLSDEEPPVLAARLVTGVPAGRPLPPLAMRLATTRGTNALLEGRGADVALFITRGFRDLLRIGTQQRPDLFALDIRKPAPIERAVIEVNERIAADGTVLRALNLSQLDAPIDQALAAGIRSAAIVLLQSWLNPVHEHALAEHLRRRGFAYVSVSSDLAPAIGALPRAQTAVVNAALAPILDAYFGAVAGAISEGSLHAMTSAGGLVRVRDFRPKDGLLSGPAGGVVGAAAAARASGFSRLITFDMGGTSTDVARFDGDHQYDFEHRVGPAHILAPAVAVHSVAAGGGSVCWFDRAERSLRVGPRSAGAHPGPACYGAGGPLTVTDLNLLLGRLDPARLEIPLSRPPAEVRARELLAELAEQTGETPDLTALLEGLIDLADEHMAQAIREISVQRGEDPAAHTLVAFGGAGGQHACGVADRLAIGTILLPADVGLLSAAGLGAALIERFAERQVLRPLDAVAADLPALLDELAATATEQVAAEGVPPDEITLRRRILALRLAGQDSSLDIELTAEEPPALPLLRERFAERYRNVYGYAPAGRPIELASVRVVASSRPRPAPALPAAPAPSGDHRPPRSTIRACFRGVWTDAVLVERASFAAGETIAGPAIIVESFGTTVLPPEWNASPDRAGSLLLRRLRATPSSMFAAPDAVRNALLAGRLSAIASEMGHTLRRTALSTNVKERLDFSCAILDPSGDLVVNAPHIPVHLGALGPCVRALRSQIAMKPGDVVVTNHPASGGSHLPDVTVVTPVHDDAGRLLAYVASRAHHAEIGGVTPGSMPPAARTLAEEGVVIPPMHLVRRGVERFDAVERVLTSAPHPTRAVHENLADLAAQAAANQRGAAALTDLAHEIGADGLAAAMRDLQDRAELRIREAAEAFGDAVHEAEDALDDGSPIRVRIAPRPRGGLIIDFSGSAPVHPGNFNAPAGVVRSAVIYVLRLLVREALPLNDGLMRAVDLVIPEGMLNPPLSAAPEDCPAVAAGNVETSQRVVDVLLKALGLAAGSQGTMNNTIFGNARFGCYETVCGGAGAGPGFHGASAVHTHMTNTRITDPEILERRFPVRVERFEIRAGSGGRGEWSGGDGVVRELTFLEPVSLSLLTQRRRTAPYALAGGEPGLPGAQRIIRAGGETVPLGPVENRELAPGDRLVLETPGGGGYGKARPKS